MNAAQLMKAPEDITTFAPYKPGWYWLNLRQVEERLGKQTGNPFISLDFNIDFQTGNRRVWVNLPTSTVTEKGMAFLSNMFSQLTYGFDEHFDPAAQGDRTVVQVLQQSVGKPILAYLRTKDGKLEADAFDFKHEHGDAAMPKAAARAAYVAPKVPMDTEYDDDIPFNCP